MLMLILGLHSCDQDFLDKAVSDDLTKEEVFSDEIEATKFLANVYSELNGGFAWVAYTMLACCSDEAEGGFGWTAAQKFNNGAFNAAALPPFGAYGWNKTYSKVRKANLFIENIDNAANEINQATIDRMKGEALFLRAYYYFEMFRFHGRFIIVDKTLTPNDELLMDRNSIEECVAFMAKDFDDAAELLPKKHEQHNYGRATKGAALAFKSRLLLYAASELYNPSNDQNKWTAAANAAKATLDLNAYNLHPDYERCFLDLQHEEIIFANQKDNGQEWLLNPNRWGGWSSVHVSHNLGSSFEMANGKAITDPTSGFDPNNPFVNRDPRFYASVLYNDMVWRGRTVEFFNGGADAAGAPISEPNKTGYHIRKFCDPNYNPNDGSTHIEHNWIFMRLGEVYLNYAEAKNEADGPTSEVYAAIKEIRDRAGMPELPLGLSKEQMRERIRQERRVELCLEDHRFFDVRRWKIADQTERQIMRLESVKNNDGTFTYTEKIMENRTFEERFYLMPIPQDEIDKNENLTQNPGW